MGGRFAALTGVGAPALLAGAVSAVLPWWPRPDGPIAQPDPHGHALPVEVGEVVTDAFDMLVVEGGAQLTFCPPTAMDGDACPFRGDG